MKKQKSKYELLAPAGDMSMLVAAVNAGADSVYLGLKDFNMRATARNFSIENLKESKKICNKKGVKIYLTMNTIMYPEEVQQIARIIPKVKKYVDAIICWDLSVVELCKKNKIPFHISTQASISNVEAAKFYKRIGTERVVLARELNLKQIKEIVKKVKIESENAKIAIRNIRKEINEKVKKSQKEGVPEDDVKVAEQQVQKTTDAYIKKIDDLTAVKEAELMHV